MKNAHNFPLIERWFLLGCSATSLVVGVEVSALIWLIADIVESDIVESDNIVESDIHTSVHPGRLVGSLGGGGGAGFSPTDFEMISGWFFFH